MKQAAGILTGVLLVLQFACNDATTTTPQTATQEKIKVENQGVHIDYDASKYGDTTLLFIHGWGINRTYWTNQASHFVPGLNYRVVMLDLPGFGQSGKNRKSWTIENYAADISALIKALDLKNVILIGHSMSGAIIVETALTNPGRVIGIVGVDNFKNVGYVLTPERKKEADKFYEAFRTHYTELVMRYMDKELFAPSTDSLIHQEVINDILHSDSTIAVDILAHADSFPLAAKLASLKKRLYLINSSYTPTDTAALRKGGIDYALYDMGPTGHYPMVEKPALFNSLLQEIIYCIK
ncbi:MAG: alpha/beta hydrolase [Niastella sp.]|nr:alpha/beta hydrolase [Niastella sp.]